MYLQFSEKYKYGKLCCGFCSSLKKFSLTEQFNNMEDYWNFKILLSISTKLLNQLLVSLMNSLKNAIMKTSLFLVIYGRLSQKSLF
uniref:Uncharacterized protein n=1 Tax=Octopus bimaculoides TaxID=37653 RepID=A0A0L8HXM0_OCTBM